MTNGITVQIHNNAYRNAPVERANSGDHGAVFQLLQEVFHAPSSADFSRQHDDPFYEPQDRFIHRASGRVIGHVRVSHREMMFQTAATPVSVIRDFAVAQSHQRQGIGKMLLSAAVEECRQQGSAIAVLRTESPEYFARLGWVCCGGNEVWRAAARRVLPVVSDGVRRTFESKPKRSDVVAVRLWRRNEQESLATLYNSFSQLIYGALRRTDDYWRWLVERAAHDRIYVAEQHGAVIGYAIIVGSRIVEFVTGDSAQATRAILRLACRDAIENERDTIQLDSPHCTGDAAPQQYFRRANDSGSVTRSRLSRMIKVLNERTFLDAIANTLRNHLKDAGYPQPQSLFIKLPSINYELKVARRCTLRETPSAGRNYLACSQNTLFRLLAGAVSFADAAESQTTRASTKAAATLATALFPKPKLWLAPFEEWMR